MYFCVRRLQERIDETAGRTNFTRCPLARRSFCFESVIRRRTVTIDDRFAARRNGRKGKGGGWRRIRSIFRGACRFRDPGKTGSSRPISSERMLRVGTNRARTLWNFPASRKWALTFRVDRESTPRENCVCDKKGRRKREKRRKKKNETKPCRYCDFTNRVHRSMNFEPPMNFYSRASAVSLARNDR